MSYEPETYRKKWMSDDQWECSQMAADLMYGFHHVSDLRRWGNGVAINHPNEIATFDFNAMTRLVVMAHDRMIRVGARVEEIERVFEGHEYTTCHLVITFHKRHLRDGKMVARHPTLEEHVDAIRKPVA